MTQHSPYRRIADELGDRIAELYASCGSLTRTAELLTEEGHPEVTRYYAFLVLQERGIQVERRKLRRRAGFRIFNVRLTEEQGQMMNELCTRHPTLTTSDVGALAIRLLHVWERARDRMMQREGRRPAREELHRVVEEFFACDPDLARPTMPCPPPEGCCSVEG
jgi:hypothetical protein